MQQTNERASGKPARGFFSKEREAELLAQAIGEPTGVFAVVGGVEFDLVPFSTADGEKLLASIARLNAFWQRMQTGTVNDGEVQNMLDTDALFLLRLIESVLRESAEAADPDFDHSVFAAWFHRTRFFPMLKATAPGILRANGFDRFAENVEKMIAGVAADENPPKPTPRKRRTLASV